MKRSATVALYLLLGGFIVIAFAKRPAWVDTPPTSPLLFQGFGTADDTGSAEQDRLRADQNARTEIIQQISSTLSSEIKSYYQQSSGSEGSTHAKTSELFTSLSSIFSDGTIEGLRIADRYHDKRNKIYYSYAVLAKADYEAQMARRAGAARAYAEQGFETAQQALKGGNIGIALSELSKALGQVLVSQSIVKRHLQGDLNNDGQTAYLDQQLSAELIRLLNQAHFIKLGGDNQRGERNQALFNALNGRLMFGAGDQASPLKNVPLIVSVTGAEAEFPALIRTNADGYFEVSIRRMISASSPHPQVRINFYFPELTMVNQESNDLELSAGAVFDLQMDVTSSVTVFVRILEEINGARLPHSKSESKVIKALISQKYKVIDGQQLAQEISLDALDPAISYEDYGQLADVLAAHATYAVIGLVASETSSTGTLNYARGSANLHAIDLRNGRIIAAASQDNVKAAGNTEKKANDSALRKSSYAAISEIMQGLAAALK